MDGAGHALATGQVGIKHEDQIHHEADDLTRGEVLPGVLVQCFVELPQQVLKDIARLVVGHGGGAEVHLALLIEALHEDDFLKLALLESAVEQVGNRPQEADDVIEFGGFVHGIRRLLESELEIGKRLRGRGGRCRRARGR